MGAQGLKDIYQIFMLPEILLAFIAGSISEIVGAICY
jgi:hypothetical protein